MGVLGPSPMMAALEGKRKPGDKLASDAEEESPAGGTTEKQQVHRADAGAEELRVVRQERPVEGLWGRREVQTRLGPQAVWAVGAHVCLPSGGHAAWKRLVWLVC